MTKELKSLPTKMLGERAVRPYDGFNPFVPPKCLKFPEDDPKTTNESIKESSNG